MSVLNHKKLSANQGIRKREVLLANFIGGLAWGLGSVIGATLIVALLVYILNLLGLIDFVKYYFPQNQLDSVRIYRPN